MGEYIHFDEKVRSELLHVFENLKDEYVPNNADDVLICLKIIKGQYYASHITYDYYGHPNELQRILECYERAIRYGNTKTARAKAKLKAKYGLREWETI